MELEAAKMIGAGLAAIALAGAGVEIGIIFGNYLLDDEKSISSSKTISKPFVRFCIGKATGLFGLVVALIILLHFN